MAKQILLTVFLTLFLTTSYAQKKEKIKGDRNVTSKETVISDFNRIVVGEKFQIDLIEGTQPTVFVEADDNLHDVINFNVADSTLTFSTSKRITTSKKMRIKVTYTKSLRQIETNENGEVSSLTSINLDDIVLVNSGSSKAYLNIKTTKFKFINSDKARVKLNVTADMATLELNETSKVEALITTDSMQVDMYQRSDAKIEGNVNYLNIRADNSATFTGKNLTSNTCDVLSELNSDVYVQVMENLTVDASGNSEIYIYDDPKIVINRFAGTAKLHKKELKQ